MKTNILCDLSNTSGKRGETISLTRQKLVVKLCNGYRHHPEAKLRNPEV